MLFLGGGASKPFGIPTMGEFTDVVLQDVTGTGQTSQDPESPQQFPGREPKPQRKSPPPPNPKARSLSHHTECIDGVSKTLSPSDAIQDYQGHTADE